MSTDNEQLYHVNLIESLELINRPPSCIEISGGRLAYELRPSFMKRHISQTKRDVRESQQLVCCLPLQYIAQVLNV